VGTPLAKIYAKKAAASLRSATVNRAPFGRADARWSPHRPKSLLSESVKSTQQMVSDLFDILTAVLNRGRESCAESATDWTGYINQYAQRMSSHLIQ
jgi:hypothetical protein